MKKILSACAGMTTLLALLLVTPAVAAEPSTLRTITVSGQSERSIAPDEAHLTINFGALDKKLENAKTAHDKKLQEVLSITKAAGIAEAQVKTLSFTTQPQYTWQTNKQVFRGYRVQSTFDVTVRETSKLGELMDKLSSAGLEAGDGQEWGSLLSLSYHISNPEKIRNEMLADAIRNARAKAENMASAAGGKVGDVVQINESAAPNFIFQPQPMLAMAAMEDKAAAPAPPAGEQKVTATVTVVFELR